MKHAQIKQNSLSTSQQSYTLNLLLLFRVLDLNDFRHLLGNLVGNSGVAEVGGDLLERGVAGFDKELNDESVGA